MNRSATLRLRAGVTHAELPDGRMMKTATDYVVAYEDFLRISPSAFDSVVKVKSVDTTPLSRESIDLTTNTASLPTYVVGGVTTSRKLGKVTEGWAGEAFRLVKLVDAVNVIAGDVLVWSSKAKNEVTADKVGGSASSPLEFAGVALGAGTAGRYIWIQVDGVASAAVDSSIELGEPVELDPTVDKVLRSARSDEVQVITLSAFSGTDSFKLTYESTETAAFVRGTNATAAAIQTALRTATGNTNLTVTGTTDAGPFTVTFVQSGDDVSQITVTSAVGCSGTVASTTVGGYSSGAVTVGVAISTPSGNLADVQLTWPGTLRTSRRNRHRQYGRDIYTNP